MVDERMDGWVAWVRLTGSSDGTASVGVNVGRSIGWTGGRTERQGSGDHSPRSAARVLFLHIRGLTKEEEGSGTDRPVTTRTEPSLLALTSGHPYYYLPRDAM